MYNSANQGEEQSIKVKPLPFMLKVRGIIIQGIFLENNYKIDVIRKKDEGFENKIEI